MQPHKERFQELADTERQILTEVIPTTINALPDGELPWPLDGAEANLARFALLAGPDDARAVAASIDGAATRALRHLADDASADRPLGYEEVALALSALAISLVLHTIGSGTGPENVAEILLARAAGTDLGDVDRRRGSVTALGYGLPDMADEIRDGVWLPEPLAVFFETATEWMRGNTSPEDLRASWSGLVSEADRVVDEYTFGYPALIAAGRVIHVLLDGEAEETVAERVRVELLA